MIALACAALTGPLLASAATGLRDYVGSSGGPDEDGFSLDGDGVFVSPNTIVVTGTRPPSPPPRNPPPSWGFGWGDNCGGSDSGCGGDGGGDPPISPENPLVCERGSGNVNMTFDGRTIRVTAGYAPNGPHAASVASYVVGIERIWTVDFPEAGIGIVTDLVPDPNGFVFSFHPNYHFNAGFVWGGPNNSSEIRLGPLDGYTEPLLSGRYLVAAHEFGHFWFGQNSDAGTQLPISLMANAADGQILSSDLRKMVEACQTGGWAQ